MGPQEGAGKREKSGNGWRNEKIARREGLQESKQRKRKGECPATGGNRKEMKERCPLRDA